jgi:hypothetical protein
VVDGYEGFAAAAPKGRLDPRLVAKARNRVADFYTAWGKPDRAAKWREVLPPPRVER